MHNYATETKLKGNYRDEMALPSSAQGSHDYRNRSGSFGQRRMSGSALESGSGSLGGDRRPGNGSGPEYGYGTMEEQTPEHHGRIGMGSGRGARRKTRGGWSLLRIAQVVGMMSLVGTGTIWGISKMLSNKTPAAAEDDGPEGAGGFIIHTGTDTVATVPAAGVGDGLVALPTSPDATVPGGEDSDFRTGYIQLATLPFSFTPSPPPTATPSLTLDSPNLASPSTAGLHPRLILIGDVHGALPELLHLLKKVSFDPQSRGDHLILTGDLVSKGPDTRGVIDLMMEYSRNGAASCVRGNHDDRVVRAYAKLHGIAMDAGVRGEEEEDDPDADGDGGTASAHADRKQRKRISDMEVAKMLSPRQAAYLSKCPLILRVPGAGQDKSKGKAEDATTTSPGTMAETSKANKPAKAQPGDILVVHAGIVPGIPLRNQRPHDLMNMRSITGGRHHPRNNKNSQHGSNNGAAEVKRNRKGWGKGSSSPSKGRHWAAVWNEFEDQGGGQMIDLDGNTESQETKKEEERIERSRTRATVVYGHYAAKGLDLRTWTKGLDSNCVRGGRLSALVIERGSVKKLAEGEDGEGQQAPEWDLKEVWQRDVQEEKSKKDDDDGGEMGLVMRIVSVGCSKYV